MMKKAVPSGLPFFLSLPSCTHARQNFAESFLPSVRATRKDHGNHGPFSSHRTGHRTIFAEDFAEIICRSFAERKSLPIQDLEWTEPGLNRRPKDFQSFILVKKPLFFAYVSAKCTGHRTDFAENFAEEKGTIKMARTYLMNWDGEPNYRWRKTYQGKLYSVTCQQLGAMIFTAEASYKLANNWWCTKFAELTGDPTRMDTLARHLTPPLNEDRREQRRQEKLDKILTKLVETPPQERKRAVALMQEIDQLDETAAVVEDRTIKFHADRFLSIIQGSSKPLTFREIRQYLTNLVKVLGPANDVAIITEERVEETFLGLKNSELSPGVKKKRWGFFQRWVDFLIEKRAIKGIGNIHSKAFKFKVPTKKVREYDTGTVKDVLASLTPRLRLYAMLGLNCGMISEDIGQLTKDMISGDKLTRKRVKTQDKESTPEVTYTLWAETLALLDQCKSDHPTLVLTGKTGQALWSSRLLADGTTPQKDMINQQWKRAKVSIPIHSFRAIAANLINNTREYGADITELFLGRSPKNITQKHYVGGPMAVLQEALAWLRTQIV